MRKKILIVDDDPDVVLYLATVLGDHGYSTIDAPNGRAGLDKMKTERPDLVLLDLMMPLKSGIAMLKDIKDDESLRDTPIIMITGVSGEVGIDLEAFFRKSPDGELQEDSSKLQGYIEKPVDPETLLRLVKKVLK